MQALRTVRFEKLVRKANGDLVRRTTAADAQRLHAYVDRDERRRAVAAVVRLVEGAASPPASPQGKTGLPAGERRDVNTLAKPRNFG